MWKVKISNFRRQYNVGVYHSEIGLGKDFLNLKSTHCNKKYQINYIKFNKTTY